MADKIKDADDVLLENLFGAAPIADDGFSDRVVRRIRRKLWIRRLSLPVAAAIGASISVKPLAALLTTLFGLAAGFAETSTLAISTAWLPPLHLIVTGAMVLVAAVLGIRMLEE